MPSHTLTYSNQVATRYLNAIGYTTTIDDGHGVQIPNPITPAQAFKNGIINDIKVKIKNAEAPAVQAAALNTNSADVETNILIT